MTTASETAAEKQAEKDAMKAREKEIAEKQKDANQNKKGIGVRTFYGMTRGRNPQMISYDQWDVDQEIEKVSTVPTSFAEVLDINKTRGLDGDAAEKEIVKRWLLGDNEMLYKEASDPVAEFVEASWDDADKKAFKLVIKNYATSTATSIEDTVALFKPGFTAAVEKRAKEAAEKA
jgi:hypothetical protein